MLLDRARVITWGGVFTAIGVLLAVVSIYTPVAPRVLLLSSGLPVLVCGRVLGFRGSLMVYSATGLIILLLFQPLKGVAYLLLTGAIPLLLSRGVKNLTAVMGTFALSLVYMGISLQIFGMSPNQLQQVVSSWVPNFNLKVIVLMGLLIFSIVYPWALRRVGRELERHWVFQQLFKP